MKTIAVLLALLGAGSVWADDLTFTHAGLKLSFWESGRIGQIEEVATGRKLIKTVTPWVSFNADKKFVVPEKLTRRGDTLVFEMTDGSRIEEKVSTFEGGFAFEVTACELKSACPKVTLAMVKPACTRYIGRFACISSDDESAVCLRSFDYHLGMSTSSEGMSVATYSGAPAIGMRFGLVGGARADILPKLRSLVKTAGLTYSEAGGPWSLGSEEARKSYFFANMRSNAADAWIDAVKRSGASILHFHCWENSLGHYDVNTVKYPGGIAEMKAIADRARAEGLGISMHSLTACISFYDSWVTPVAHSNLIATYTYTLAAPITQGTTEILVDELPGPKHDYFTSYASNGNLLEVDGEIISYSGIRHEKPYAFTGIKRGEPVPSLKSTVRDHAKGARVKYLQHRYMSFYPEPDSPLAVELADRLAGVYNAIGSDMIYFDGSEGMKAPYGIAKMGALIAERLDRSRHAPHIEMSSTYPHFWPLRSTIGAWDRVSYGAKTFEDDHIRSNENMGRKSNFLDGQMGWWAPNLASKSERTMSWDEIEYFGAKNAGFDYAMSLQGINAGKGFIPDWQEKAITLLGWYERFRLARVFAPEVQKDLATLGHEGELRQNEKGEWVYAPVQVMRKRINGEGVGDKWTYVVNAECPAKVHIEHFYNLSAYDSPAAVKLFDVPLLTAAKKSAASAKIKMDATCVSDPERGEVVRVTAFNDTDTPRGAYACFERTFPGPQYFDIGAAGGVGFWVKGDGSGAILNIQLENSPQHYRTHADHLVKLNFKGWRYVELLFRERDTDEARQYVWPHVISHPEQMCAFVNNRTAAVRVYLNEIPVSEGEGVLDSNAVDASARNPSVDIALGEIRALGLKETTAEDVTLKVNGEKLEVPFEMAAGDWVDLEDGVWRHYSEKGVLKECAKGPQVMLQEGKNKFKYSADVSDRAQARAEIKIVAKGGAMPALKPLTAEARRALAWEPEMPVDWSPVLKKAETLPPVRVRPGEKAKLEVKVRGPVENPVVRVGGQTWKLESVGKNRVKTFRDGPVVQGVNAVSISSSKPAEADALIEFAKNYIP